MAFLKYILCQYRSCMGPMRYLIVATCFLAAISQYVQRSIFATVFDRVVIVPDHPDFGREPICPATIKARNVTFKPIEWKYEMSRHIFATELEAYTVLQLVASPFCDRNDAKNILLIGCAVALTATFLSPMILEKYPPWTTLIFRALAGAGQGLLYTTFASLISRWIPPKEKATMCGIVFSAGPLGIIVGNFAAESLFEIFQEWQYTLFMANVSTMIVIPLAYFFVFPEPNHNVNQIEYEYLNGVLPKRVVKRLPLLAILKDWCVWGIISAQLGHSLETYLVIYNIHKYMEVVLGINSDNCEIFSLILLFHWVSALGSGILADYLVNKRNANITSLRKLYTTISNLGTAICMIFAGYSNCNVTMALTWLSLSIFIKGFFHTGLRVTIMDFTVNHVSFVFSLVNGLGSAVGVFCTLFINDFAPDDTLLQWHVIFWSVLGLQFISITFYLLMATSERRYWDYGPGETMSQRKKTKWYLELTWSDHELRLQREKDALDRKKSLQKITRRKTLEHPHARIEPARHHLI